MERTSTERPTPNKSDMRYMPDLLAEILHTLRIFRKPPLSEGNPKQKHEQDPLKGLREGETQICGEERNVA